MYIKKIEIDSFGCLSHKSLTFDKGFNLIYGLNESGKSTLFAFVIFMFYGTKIKKLPADLTFKDRYMPWSGKPMHGKITFYHDNGTYIISRLYSEQNNHITIYREDTSEEIKDRTILNSPGEYFFGISAEAFYRSTYICAMQGKYNAMSADEIVSKLTNACETVSTEVSYGKITDIINNEISILSSTKRKNAVIPSNENKIFLCKQKLNQIGIDKEELNRLSAENQILDDEIKSLEQELKELKSDLTAKPMEKEKPSRAIYVIFITLLAISLLALLIIPNKYTLIISVIVLVFSCILAARRIKRTVQKRRDDARKLFTMQTNNDKIVLITEQIISIKTKKIQNSERCRVLSSSISDKEKLNLELSALENELKENKTRLEALELALTVLNKAFGDFKAVFSPQLSELTGKILSSITNGKYDSTLVDESLSVSVDDGYDYRNALSFSQGAAEQTYFAMRIALSKILLSGKDAPLLLDDALAFYDDERLRAALDYLVGISENTQVIFSTCRSTELSMLRDKKINTFYF